MSDDLRTRLRDLRVFDEDLPEFDTGAAPDDPVELFVRWLEHAIDAGVRAPHAMTLATIDPYGHANSRVLLLKGLEDGRFEFATSRGSNKGRELEETRSAAANFHWPEVGRQVRVRGRVADAGREAAVADFKARGEASRAESFHGRQSRPLADPAELDEAFESARSAIEADPELVPDHWAVYRLVPQDVEFWQGRANRRHVRLRYRRSIEGWTRGLLWP